MNKYKELVYKTLKPKVASLGFTKNELESAAAVIADNLHLEDDATEEVVNATIDKAVNTMIPVLQLAQSQASRTIEKFKSEQDKKAQSVGEADDDDDDENDAAENQGQTASQASSSSRRPKLKAKDGKDKEVLMTLLSAVESLKSEINGLKTEKVASSRRDRLEAALKDTGTFGKQTLKSFSKMSFADDDEFEDFLSEVSQSVVELKKEYGNEALGTMTKHPNNSDGGQKKELTDSEIDSVVAAL